MKLSYILVFIGVVMVSYSGPLVKGALLTGANPVTIAFLRMAIAGAFMLLLICVPQGKEKQPPVKELKRLTLPQWLWSVAASACLALHYYTWMTSLSATSTFASVALVCTQPLFVAALSGLVLKERMNQRSIPGAVVALIGTALIGLDSMLTGGSTGTGDGLWGDLLALLGAALMAGHWLCSRYSRRSVSAVPFTTLVYLQTALILGLLMPFSGGFQMTGTALWYVLGLAVGSTLMGHFLFQIALGRVSATVVSFAMLGEPVGAMLWSMLMFGEIPTPMLLVGGGVVLLGLVLYTAGTLKSE